MSLERLLSDLWESMALLLRVGVSVALVSGSVWVLLHSNEST